MVQTSGSDQADVVFLIEGTAINGAYINDMKLNYILPTLEYFSQTSEEDVSAVDKYNVYGLVLYRTAQAMPGSCCSTFGPFTSTQKLVNAIDRLELTGGKSESYANMAMGMSVAMQCFEDIAEVRNGGRVSSSSPAAAQGPGTQKHCIMICNSAPYSMPVPLNGQPFEMKNFEQLAALFNEVNMRRWVSAGVSSIRPIFLFRRTSTCRFSRPGRSPSCLRFSKRPAEIWVIIRKTTARTRAIWCY